MPEIYIHNIVRMAWLYPDVEFTLWVDSALMGSAGVKALQSTYDKQKCSPIRVRDLNEIPGFRDEPFFRALSDAEVAVPSRNGYEFIWRKVDLARVVMLDHVLNAVQDTAVFYSDVDLVDPQLSSRRLQRILDAHGMVFAQTDRNGLAMGYDLENSFLSIHTRSGAFVRDVLLPATREATTLYGGSGWEPLKRSVRERFSGIALDEIALPIRELERPQSGSSLDQFAGLRGVFKGMRAPQATSLICLSPSQRGWGDEDIQAVCASLDAQECGL